MFDFCLAKKQKYAYASFAFAYFFFLVQLTAPTTVFVQQYAQVDQEKMIDMLDGLEQVNANAQELHAEFVSSLCPHF